MSGFIGTYRAKGLEDADRSAAPAMLEALAHRGPGRSAHVSDAHVLLGGVGSAAPGKHGDDATPNVFAVCDGEICNAPELREYLASRGHAADTADDAQLLPPLYREYGPEFVLKLRGEFALALWDGREQRLVLARDRVGAKPLYYTRAGGRLIFASEIKALLLHPAVERRPDLYAMHHALSFRHAPGEDTVFLNVKKLPPAHLMTAGGGPPEPRRYWQAARIRVEKKSTAVEDAAVLLDLLTTSVRRRLAGEESVGVLLSGGLGSSAVAGLAARIAPSRVETFTLGFDEPGSNETHYARLVARRFKLQNTQFVAQSGELLESVPLLVWHCDEPVGDPAVPALHYLCKCAREHVPAVLAGNGCDELFGGLDHYVADSYLHYYNYIPPQVRRNIMTPMLSYASHSATGPAQENLEQMASVSPYSDAERHLNWTAPFTHYEKMLLYHPDIARELRSYNSGELMQLYYNRTEGFGRGFTEQQLLVDFLTRLPETALMGMDRAGMANGLRVRFPVAAKEVAELALSLPANMKIKGATTKRVLKQALWNFLPAEILYRRKQTPEPPLGAWFRGPLRDLARDYLTDDTAARRGLFNPVYVERLLNENEHGFRDHGRKLWALLNIEFWFRIFLDSAPPAAPPAMT